MINNLNPVSYNEWIQSTAYLIREPDQPGLLIIPEHSIFGIQQFPHDEQKKLFANASSIHSFLPYKNHLQHTTQWALNCRTESRDVPNILQHPEQGAVLPWEVSCSPRSWFSWAPPQHPPRCCPSSPSRSGRGWQTQTLAGTEKTNSACGPDPQPSAGKQNEKLLSVPPGQQPCLQNAHGDNYWICTSFLCIPFISGSIWFQEIVFLYPLLRF